MIDKSGALAGDVDGVGGDELGAGVTGSLGLDREASANTVDMFGLAVNALNWDDFKTFGISAGGSVAVAVNIGGSVNVIETTTQAHIDDRASINGGTNEAAGNAQSVLVTAGSDYRHWGIAGGLSLSGGGAVTPGADVLILDTTTDAFIGNAEVHAKGDVRVRAASYVDVLSIAGAVAGSGTISLAGAASVQLITNNTTAYISNDITATESHHAAIDAGGTVLVSATDDTNAFMIADSLGIGLGAAGVGASASILIVDKDTRAFIGAFAQVDGRADIGSGVTVYDGAIDSTREDIFGTNTTSFGVKPVKGGGSDCLRR